jgi:hypothetical protein
LPKLLFFVLAAFSLLFAQTKQWQIHEITLTAAKTYSNPFIDVSITAVFTGPDGTVIRRPGYWYAGNTWKIRFAPTLTGNWGYTVTCSDTTDTGLHHKSGDVVCIPYAGDLEVYKHGFLKVSDNKRYLAHRDGTPFWYLGDTHWFMEQEDYDTVFTVIVDKRVSQKYTAYQSHPVRQFLSNSGATTIDTLNYQKLDRYFQYIADKGLVHAFALDCHTAIDYFTPEGSRRLAKYVCARYGAYPVVYFTSQEVDLYNNETKWKNAFDEWNLWDDYQHPATCHMYYSTTGEPKLWGTDPEHDLFFLQGGHGAIHAVSHYKSYWDFSTPAKPFLEAECNYEEIFGGNHADIVRNAAYKAIQCGSAGFGYGANGLWNNCFSSTDCSCCKEWVGLNVWSQALNFPGGAQMQYLTEFYTGLDWWKLTPRFFDPAWSSFVNPDNAILKTDAASTYVVYFYGAGSTGSLRGMVDSTRYNARWFNPSNGISTVISDSIRPVQGSWTPPAKPDANDWILLVQGDVDTSLYGLVQVRQSAGGRMFPSGDLIFPRNTGATFHIMPKAGYAITDVFLDSISLGPVSEYTLDSAGSGHTLSAVFSGVPVPGLVSWWPLEGCYAPFTTVDTAGGFDGTVNGGAVFQDSGAQGRCLSLSGSGYVSVPDDAALENMDTLTLSCWINISALPSQNAAPVCKEGAYRIVINSAGEASFVVATNKNGWYSAGTNVSFGSALRPGIWYHLKAVYDGAYLTAYLNGVLVQTTATAISGYIINNANPLTFGLSTGPNINNFNGKIDDVKIYNTIFPDTLITLLDVFPSTDKDLSLSVAPNPFNPSVAISVSGWQACAELKILDVSGKVVADLTQALNRGSQGKGQRNVSWSALSRASGVYIVMLKNGKAELKRKVMLIR